jgi:hypothetical protein
MQLDVLIELLHRKFLLDMLGEGSQHVSYFFKKSKHGKLEFIDNTGASDVHMLRFEPIPNSLGSGNMEDCAHLGKTFVQKLIDCLNGRFTDLLVFNATKLFSPCSYFEEENERENDIGDSPIIDKK